MLLVQDQCMMQCLFKRTIAVDNSVPCRDVMRVVMQFLMCVDSCGRFASCSCCKVQSHLIARTWIPVEDPQDSMSVGDVTF
jgi:hypothetical protein